MAQTLATQVTFLYEDDTTRNLNFQNVSLESLDGLKPRISQFNQTVADETQGEAYKETFISDDGAAIKKISKAKYTITEEQVIYND